jgi:signal transduction histidine kinase
VRSKVSSPVLAEAADVLSDQLRVHVRRLAQLLKPHASDLERRFLNRLRDLGFDAKKRSALAAITPGASARILADENSPARLFEAIEYSGRRLAKLNVPPGAIVQALQEYDRLLTPALRKLIPTEYENFKWVREQLHFCVVLTLNNAFYQVRESETQAFYELFRAELESKSVEELVRRLLGTLAGFCHANAGHLFLLSDDGGSWQKASVHPLSNDPDWEAGTPAALPNTAALQKRLSAPRLLTIGSGAMPELLDRRWHQHFKSCWSIPLASGGRVAGVLQFGFSKRYDWLPREQELLAAAAERCLLAAEKARLIEDLARREEQVRSLAEHMLHVEEMERRRISRERHDEAGQSLLCIRLQLEMFEQQLPHAMRTKLAEVRKVTEHTIIEIRRLIAALSPAVLEQLGLGAALRQLVSRFRRVQPCHVRLHVPKLTELPQQTEVIVYRLVQECFNNVAKHSFAEHLHISLSSADGVLRLNVEDDGVGFSVEEAISRRDSYGLSGMRERVTLLGGRFEVESWPQSKAKRKRGTRITVELPIPSNSRPGVRARAAEAK